MQAQNKAADKTINLPRWLAKFILSQVQGQPNNQRIFLALLQPMAPLATLKLKIQNAKFKMKEVV